MCVRIGGFVAQKLHAAGAKHAKRIRLVDQLHLGNDDCELIIPEAI